MNLISAEYLESFSLGCQTNWDEVSLKMHDHENKSSETLKQYLKDAAHYSFKSDEIQSTEKLKNIESIAEDPLLSSEVQDLYHAYLFALEHPLNKQNFLQTFEILSSHLLSENHQSIFRQEKLTQDESNATIPLYVALEAENVESKFSILFDDIEFLKSEDLTTEETFYYASVIHLWLLKINPFAAANDAAARFLEKWFLATKIGRGAWCINSEKYYFENLATYHQNLSLGFNFYALFWGKCIPFLLILPDALEQSAANKTVS